RCGSFRADESLPSLEYLGSVARTSPAKSRFLKFPTAYGRLTRHSETGARRQGRLPILNHVVRIAVTPLMAWRFKPSGSWMDLPRVNVQSSASIPSSGGIS